MAVPIDWGQLVGGYAQGREQKRVQGLQEQQIADRKRQYHTEQLAKIAQADTSTLGAQQLQVLTELAKYHQKELGMGGEIGTFEAGQGDYSPYKRDQITLGHGNLAKGLDEASQEALFNRMTPQGRGDQPFRALKGVPTASTLETSRQKVLGMMLEVQKGNLGVLDDIGTEALETLKYLNAGGVDPKSEQYQLWQNVLNWTMKTKASGLQVPQPGASSPLQNLPPPPWEEQPKVSPGLQGQINLPPPPANPLGGLTSIPGYTPGMGTTGSYTPGELIRMNSGNMGVGPLAPAQMQPSTGSTFSISSRGPLAVKEKETLDLSKRRAKETETSHRTNETLARERIAISRQHLVLAEKKYQDDKKAVSGKNPTEESLTRLMISIDDKIAANESRLGEIDPFNPVTSAEKAQRQAQIKQLRNEKTIYQRKLDTLRGTPPPRTGGPPTMKKGKDLKMSRADWQKWIRGMRAEGYSEGEMTKYMTDHLWSSGGAKTLIKATK